MTWMFPGFAMRAWLVPAVACLAVAACPQPGWADQAEAVPYRIEPGDTLYALAERYLQGPGDWRLLARANRLPDPLRLVPGSTIGLPLARMRTTPLELTVAYVRGPVVAVGQDGRERPLAVGDLVREGESVHVPTQAFATLRQRDGSELQLPASSRLRLRQLREIEAANRSQSVFELERGRVDSSVRPQRAGSRFEVQTPLAIAGVRGTRFGVALTGTGMVSDVTQGLVAVQALQTGDSAAQVAAGQGAVVGASGGMAVRPLLPAPDMAGVPPIGEQMPLVLAPAPVDGAARYSLQVAEDDGFTRVVYADEAGAPPLTVAGLPDGDYHLRLRALDRDGLPGAVAQAALRIKTTPVAPLLQAPTPGQVLPRGTVRLQCSDVPQAAGYLLQIAHEADFRDASEQRAGTSACGFEAVLDTDGAYHWRVATLALNAQGSLERGPFSQAEQFVIAARPDAPGAGFEDLAGSQEVRWAGQPGMRYLVQVAAEDDLAFAHPLLVQEVGEPRARLPLPPRCGGRYAVRLQAVASNGLRSPFSAPRLLRVPQPICTGDGVPLSDGVGGAAQPWQAGY